MRILFLATDFPSPWDSARGPFNFALAQALRRKHKIRVVAPVPWTKRLFARQSSIDLAQHQLDVAHPTYLYPPKIARKNYAWFYWMSIRSAARKMVRDAQPDVILSYWAHPDGAAAVRLAKQCGAASAIIVGGSDVLLITRDPVRRAAVVEALSAADAVIAVSEHLREATIALGIDPGKVHVWSQGVDRDLFHPGDSELAQSRSILWVGRMEPVKGLDVLLDAMPIVRERFADVQLNLIGDGSQRDALVRRRRELKIEDVVHFVGHVDPAALGAWYRAASVTVLPSRSEGLPNVLRESLASGTPFVASRVGGIAEIARRGMDLLVEPNDPRALADAIVKSLEMPKHSATLAADLPTWDESAAALVKVLRPYVRNTKEPSAVESRDLVAPQS